VGTVSSKITLTGADNQNPVPSAWSWDDSRLASPTNVWDAGTGQTSWRICKDRDQQHTLDQVAWSPDGKRIYSESAEPSRFAIRRPGHLIKGVLLIPVLQLRQEFACTGVPHIW